MPIKDHVKCCNCDFEGLVDSQEEICPNCKKIGFLCWVDEEHPEIEV